MYISCYVTYAIYAHVKVFSGQYLIEWANKIIIKHPLNISL